MEHELYHVGRSILDGAPGRGSGRYPLGSGDNPNQHGAKDFMARVNELKKSGLSEAEVAKAVGCVYKDGPRKGEGNTSILRANYNLARAEHRSGLVATVTRLRDEGKTLNEITQIMGYKNDSSVRSLLNEDSSARMNKAMTTAKILKKVVDEKGMIEVGKGVELEAGVSRNKFDDALHILELEGYPTYRGRVDQTTNPTNKTTVTVLCPPGTKHSEIFDQSQIHSFKDYTSLDGGDTFVKRSTLMRPTSVSSKRLMIRYGDEGGDDMDGVVELRRGVKDLSLGTSAYAQVRIMVDGTHYIKGMAVYADDLPKGIDMRFNTNKKKGTPMMDPDPDAKQVLKPIKDDPDNPFGALIKPMDKGGQYMYKDSDGKMKLSPLNKKSDQGDWDEWRDKLPSQFLAKQPIKLARQQLDLTKANRAAEFDEICRLTNPTLRKKLLYSFAEDCDAAAVKLKAEALPGQKYKVILPMKTIGEKECYCPSIKDGTTVALIRYPHEGTYQIPILKVNNKGAEGKGRITPGGLDAIGIRKSAAERLSGADFDGDTVMVIPLKGNVQVRSTPKLKGLEGFDAKDAYPERKGMAYMKKGNVQNQMGQISNLITDMTIKGASTEELARATRHSMCVIDAYKHKLDYKRSEKENRIAELKKKYQYRVDEDGSVHTGASTIISRAKGQQSVLKRQGSPRINKETGELEWKLADQLTYVNKKGKTITKTQKSTQMAETKDARTLISSYNTEIEHLYADYANFNKSLANKARKLMIDTKDTSYQPSARKAYQAEYDSLNQKLLIAKANKPRERMANIIANSRVEAKKNEYDLDKKEVKKLKQKELERARIEVGAERKPIHITPKEFKALQAGAISPTMLREILNYADEDELRKLAMPKQTKGFTPAQIAQMKAMVNAGYNMADIGERFGVSASTISKKIKES